MELGDLLFPFSDCFCADHFVPGSKVAADAQPGLGMTRSQNFFQELVIPERGFDKDLCLTETLSRRFQVFQLFTSCSFINGKVAMKSKALSIESRSH